MTMQLEEIQSEIKQLEGKILEFRQEKQNEKLKAITDRLSAAAKQLEHESKAKAYLEFTESKAYIDQLKEAVERDGVTATNTVTGTAHKLQLAKDGKSALTFSRLKAGQLLEIHGRPILVEEFEPCATGSTATLLPFNAKFQPAERPHTPYSAVNCHWHDGTKTLTVAPQDRLQPGQQVIIGGTKFDLAAQIGIDPGKIRYELTEATA